MDRFQNSDDIIAFAIDRETEAYVFYYDLSNGIENDRMREMLREFAAEEQKHREKLLAFRDSGASVLPVTAVHDLRIADYQVTIEPEQATDYQRVLLLAMQKEKKAFQLYTDLAEAATDPLVRKLMTGLAHEEANHKLRLEIEYDDNILTDN